VQRDAARDDILTAETARVVARRDDEGRPAVVLDRTAFYAESGGQPWDLGELGGARVLAVVERGDEIVHVLDRPLEEGAAVRGRRDAERRRDHPEQPPRQHPLPPPSPRPLLTPPRNSYSVLGSVRYVLLPLPTPLPRSASVSPAGSKCLGVAPRGARPLPLRPMRAPSAAL